MNQRQGNQKKQTNERKQKVEQPKTNLFEEIAQEQEFRQFLNKDGQNKKNQKK